MGGGRACPAPDTSRAVSIARAAAMQLQLAASPRFVGPDGAAALLSARDAALLAWLALEGPTARSRLAALLWPQSDADAARNALRQRLFQLRKALGFDVVVGSTMLTLAEGVAHDLVDAGGVLGNDPPVAAGEFAAWLAHQRQRRRDRTRQTLDELAQMAEDAGDWADALSQAAELLALEPHSEAAHRRLIRLHYLAGDRAAALLAFDRCEQVLKDEVGTAPSSETLALLATVERSDAVARRPHGRHLAARAPAALLRPPRLIGRDAAWQALDDAWEAGRPVVVTGEGGMGKTRLVGDFAQSRGRTLMVSARPGDAGVVYGSLSRLLRALPGQVLHGLDPPLRRTLAALLPELGDGPAQTGTDGRTRFFNAVGTLLAAESLGVDGFVIDDLHHADAASIELLQYVLAGSPRRWIVTARAGEVSPAGRTWLDGGLAQPDAVQVSLEPLSLAQVAEVVDSLGIEAFDGAAVAATLMRHCGGNPLFLLETLKAWLAGGHAGGDVGTASNGRALLPARIPVAGTLQSLIERRVAHLSTDAVRLARCAAVAAPDFSLELASQVLGLRTLDLADPWAELEAAQVLCDGAFVHDLIHEAALASVPAAVARQLHAEIAAFLQQRQGEPARLAQHWVHAREWARAGAAFAAAAELSRDASCLSQQCVQLAEAARCYALAGERQNRFDALLMRARTLASNDLGAQASAAVHDLEQAAATEEQRLLALDARLELTMTRYELHESLELGDQAIAAARALGRPDLELRFAVIVSGALCDARRVDEAVALLEPYAESVQMQPDIAQQWEYWEATALALDYANRLGDAMPAWDAAFAVAQRAGRQDMLWKTMSNRASTTAKMGLVLQAAQDAGQAHRLARGSDETVSMRVLQMQVTLAHRLRDVGRYGEALTLLEEARAGYDTHGASQTDKALVEQRLVVLYQQLGQPARALHLLTAERPGVPPGVAMIRLAHRAELEAQMGRDGLQLMREALQIIPNTDDIFHRITTLFATRLVPADEGEALAASLALWAAARERHGVALAGHVRAAACAVAADAPVRALPHVEAAMHLARRYLPDSFYLPELWLAAARVFAGLGRAPAARQATADGLAWVRNVHDTQVPPEFRDSFLHRNAVNSELLALAARGRVSQARPGRSRASEPPSEVGLETHRRQRSRRRQGS
ncbi:MAG TPA: AAA family ATPase [Albitalea sp.]|uniref:ATP-binding protein n=1 Tax=Piscinibacter sp. TaxID=1903157 RepID=UPI002ED3F538